MLGISKTGTWHRRCLNDIGMLQLAGVAVAMENAMDVVKEVADWIAPANDDAGARRCGIMGCVSERPIFARQGLDKSQLNA